MHAAGQTDFRKAEQDLHVKQFLCTLQTVIGMPCKLNQCHPWQLREKIRKKQWIIVLPCLYTARIPDTHPGGTTTPS